MIDGLKSIAIVGLVWVNAVLIVTGCNLIGSTVVESERIAAEEYATRTYMSSEPH